MLSQTSDWRDRAILVGWPLVALLLCWVVATEPLRFVTVFLITGWVDRALVALLDPAPPSRPPPGEERTP